MDGERETKKASRRHHLIGWKERASGVQGGREITTRNQAG